ncbi:hypothetical protein [Clostridium vincentii]|uniref:Uncharacterized protein n=1 Tax=Clostridium vincentii TaxID=52704 RepID=A0A2T0BK52_9CLOT|nr:hypothetical protein [Clostridium vincentii]PRR84275.1 hypothetical protein CLVI_02010 [Clostridium vincentii]
MSRTRDSKEKKIEKIKKNSTLSYSGLIQYSDDEVYNLMKNGYMEMGEINLNLSIDSEFELGDINKYERWLCGV